MLNKRKEVIGLTINHCFFDGNLPNRLIYDISKKRNQKTANNCTKYCTYAVPIFASSCLPAIYPATEPTIPPKLPTIIAPAAPSPSTAWVSASVKGMAGIEKTNRHLQVH